MKSNKFLTLFLWMLALLAFAFTHPTPAAGSYGNTSPKKGASTEYSAAPGPTSEIVRALGISWGYNWGIRESDLVQGYYEFVPMVHPLDVRDRLTYLQDIARAYPGRYWLVFNEPDYHEQDNCSPADAAQYYYRLRIALKEADPTAKLIVGGVLWPSPTWMTGFREEYKKRYGTYPVVEGWHVHNYAEPNSYDINNWRNVMNFWKNWMMANGGMVELWLSEFGCLPSDSIGQQIMRDQIPWLESQPYVTRYAWFVLSLEPTWWFKGAMTRADGQLTALGQLYATFGNSPSSSFTIQAAAGNGGTISPSGNVPVASGGTQTFSIAPNSGYRIADVKVDGVSAGAISSKTFTNVTSNRTIEASFTATSTYSLSIAKNGSGTGNVTSSPAGSSFAAGTVVTLTATPDGSSSFAGWSGGCTGASLTCQVTMNSNISVTAAFDLKPNTYTLTATAGANGSISPQGVTALNAGESKTFTITPNTGYVIADVLIDGVSQGAISSYTFNTVTANHTVEAGFAQDRSGSKVVLAVNCGGSEYKDKTGVVYKADTGSNGGAVYNTAAAIDGTEDDILYQSERWGNFSYNIPISNGTYSVTLKFAELYESNVNARVFSVKMEGKEVIPNLDVFAKVGKNRAYDVTVPVTVNDGSLNIEFTSPKKDAKVNAILVTSTQSPTELSIKASASAGGTIHPLGVIAVSQGGQKTFTITPNAGYSTADVKVNGLSRGAISSYTFNNVSVDHTIAASFNPLGVNQYSLTVTKAGTGSGAVAQSPSGTVFSPGTLVTVTANPESGSVFFGWSGACSGTSSSCTLTMNGNRSVEASFKKSEGGGGNGTYTRNFKLDLNGDGQTDILWQHQTRGDVFVWYMQGATFLRDEHIRTVEDTNWKIVGIGDFNGDGKADILWHHQVRGDVYVWCMDGTAFLGDQYIRTVEDTDWRIVGVEDFNGDGKADILWHHQVRGDVYVWYMDGATFLGDQYIRTVGDDLNWRIVGVGDFNGDGKVDVLWHHQSRGEVYVWYMDGATFLRDQYIRTVGDDLAWKIEGLGDYNGDGKVDILWRHQVRGDLYVWYMDGATFVRDQYIRSVNRVADDLDWRIVN